MPPEIVVELALYAEAEGGRRRPLNEGEYRGVFLVGEQGFSIRFFVPPAFDEGKLQRFSVQLLAPEAALAHFPVGGLLLDVGGTRHRAWPGARGPRHMKEESRLKESHRLTFSEAFL